GAQALRQPQHVDGAVDTGLRRLHRIVLIMDRGSWAGQVIDLVGFNIERKGDVVPDDFKTAVVEQALEVTTRSGEIIVNANDVRPLLEQALAKREPRNPAPPVTSTCVSRCNFESPQGKTYPKIRGRRPQR